MAQANSNSAISPAAMLTRAFGLSDKAETSRNSGIQTMAEGVLLYYAEKTTEKPHFAAYAQGGDAYKAFKAELLETFTQEGVIAPYISSKELKADTKLSAATQIANNGKRATQIVALNRGIDLAIGLDAAGISSASFDVTKGLFVVPMSTMLKPDETALPLTVAKGGVAPTSVVLDGKFYPVWSEGKTVNFRAVPARVLEIANYRKAKLGASATASTGAAGPVTHGASDTTTTGGKSADEVRADKSTWSFDKLIASAAELLNKAADIIGDDAAEAVSFDSLPEATRNALNAIAIFRDECRMHDAQLHRASVMETKIVA